jgi:thiol:disulfide interchange protein DsbD
MLTLSLPDGAKAGPIAWPTPRRMSEGGLITYAYTDEALLPVPVTLGQQTGAHGITAHAAWLVCKDICVPEEGDFKLTLADGPAAPSAQAKLFAAADRATPRPSPWQARIAEDGTLWVGGAELRPATVIDAWFIPDRPGQVQGDAAQPLSVREGGFALSLSLAKGFRPDAGLSGVLSVRDRAGLQTDVELQARPGAPPPSPALPLVQMLGLALLGGLILNLMPCVFPVLAMKTVALARGAAHGGVRAHALSYAAGVLLAFAALGGLLLAARAAGSIAGWGFQFQSPVFVAAMTWLLFGVGLNLSGVFRVGDAFAGAGQGLAATEGHAGSFFTGLLAVLVATPCTAPFMAAAIAGALAAPPAVTILVFLAMGVGLAAPYVTLAMMPGLARVMPRPGPWMELLRQVLAFPMYAAAAWLLWVVSQEAGADGVLATSAGLVLLGFAAWALGAAQGRLFPQGRRVFHAVAMASVLGAAAVLAGIGFVPSSPVAPAREAVAGRTEAQPFTPARLAALRAEGRPVFVNMTAAWCVTCLVNERIAIATAPVQAAFASRDVAYLKGDWTRQDPAITDFLRDHGRDGVPLYIYYPPGGAPPVVLPQILTESMLLDRIQQS